jgi:hypothetical protein
MDVAREQPWDRSRVYARLGSSVRSILIAPRDGFKMAIKAAERRARLGRRPAEGVASYALAASGGAALVLLWLKIGGLLELREANSADFRWGYVAAAVFVGCVLGVASQLAWGALGRGAARRLGGDAASRDLRLVWGAAALPQVLAVVFLLPIDLVIVGRETFTTDRLSDPVATAWAALSIAVAVSLGVWSLWIFVRGMEVAAGVGTLRAVVGTVAAIVCAAVVVASVATTATVLTRAAG